MILSAVRGEGVDVSQVKLDDAAPTGLFLKKGKARLKSMSSITGSFQRRVF